ncbi:DUF6585 family protein [Dictyobacter formicarum]|uniref:Uncharacterized protein n=1 Tax=Dictyobacter formicarum TaxID=2778368 RepID=A0ABQ3VC79_9CHLR|nr:DUF6585 family protein [Dictyobacter formicarum]GHO83654.1 hypothetical protein KSZ_16600 [Dictyobacter formicarum]
MKSQQDTQNIDNELSSPYYAEVQRLATAYTLGERCSSYTQSTINGARLLINAIVWFAISIIGLFFLADAVRKIILSQTLADPPTLRSIGAIGVISLILLLGCLLQGWRNLREYSYRHREQVHVFEDGFVFLEGRQQSHVLRWDNIESLMRGSLNSKHPDHVINDTLSFITDKDVLLVLEPKVQQRTELCDTIERAYTNYRYPGMLELYRLGEDLEFGDLIINQEEISHVRANSEEEEQLPWDEIESIEVGETYTRVYSKDDPDHAWFEELTADVDNALILKELLPIIFQ